MNTSSRGTESTKIDPAAADPDWHANNRKHADRKKAGRSARGHRTGDQQRPVDPSGEQCRAILQRLYDELTKLIDLTAALGLQSMDRIAMFYAVDYWIWNSIGDEQMHKLFEAGGPYVQHPDVKTEDAPKVDEIIEKINKFFEGQG